LPILWINPAWLWLSVVYVIVITFSEMLAMPFMMSIALNRASSDRQGQYSALYSIAYGIALIVAPSLGLALAQYLSFQWMLMFFVVASVIVAFLMLQLKQKFKTN
jgi:MFS family permease